MSASREKKSRQQTGKVLTEKQRKAQREAARAKRNRVIYTVAGAAGAVLAAALLIWNSGFFQGRAKALTIGDSSYTAADVQYYYNDTYTDYYIQARYGGDTGMDLTVPLDQQMYDSEQGVTWHDHILDEAIHNMAETKGLTAEAAKAGYTLSEAGKQQVKSTMSTISNSAANAGYSSLTSYLKASYGSGMTKGRMKNILTNEQLAQEYSQQYISGLTHSEEELEAYYTEHKDSMDLFNYDYFFVSTVAPAKTDSDGNTVEPTEEENAAAKTNGLAAAKDLRDRMKSGEQMKKLASEYAENTLVTSGADQSVYGSDLNADFADWMKLENLSEGSTVMIKNADDTGYHVVRFLGRGRDTEVTVDARHILVGAEQDAGATEPTNVQYAEAREKAEKLLEKWKAGPATEESFALLAQKESADPGSAAAGGLYRNISTKTGFIIDFANWVLDPKRQPGDTGFVKNTQSTVKGWHVMYFVGTSSEVWAATANNALSEADGQAWLEQVTDSQQVTRLDGLKQLTAR